MLRIAQVSSTLAFEKEVRMALLLPCSASADELTLCILSPTLTSAESGEPDERGSLPMLLPSGAFFAPSARSTRPHPVPHEHGPARRPWIMAGQLGESPPAAPRSRMVPVGGDERPLEDRDDLVPLRT